MESHSILHCRQLIAGNLPFDYQGDGLDLEIGTGEIISLIGPRSSGKSQWLKSICGLEDQRAGNVYIHGVNTANLSAEEWTMTRMKVAYIHEDTSLLSAANGLLNVLIPALYHQLDKNPDALTDRKTGKTQLTEKALGILDEIDPMLNLDDLPAYISKEHQFKIAVARALLLEPDLLVLDNPFTHFDIDTKRQFQKFLTSQTAKGLSLLMRTHDIPYALKNSDKIIFADNENFHHFDSKQALLNSDLPVVCEYMALQALSDQISAD